ncbi:hypothetical protein [Shimia abyssi]|uniref:HdeA/HdeB family protein n=1 Tax=Shimia abyssi TaxID=1662395 RepID=A0A2P8FE79_9RHOB|nr:hypothetical protein [Shimia abyssi]PSL20022.1 hypothetical protein CLV88_10481 [Shimia abyssi]
MRLLSAVALSVAISVPALPVFAHEHASEKQAECELQAAIVTRAAELRQDRTSKKKALETMTSGEDEAVAEKYLASVPAIVEWVYEDLKRKQLKQDPGKAYFDACVAQ